MKVYRDPLDKLEAFDLPDRGYMPFLKICLPKENGSIDYRYLPDYWRDYGDEPIPSFCIWRWYQMPYRYMLFTRPSVEVGFLELGHSEPTDDEMPTPYEVGFHIYADVFAIPKGSLEGNMVQIQVRFRYVTATGWRRGNRIVVAKEIFLEWEV